MNVPSKKPPAIPTVQSLTRSALSGSRAFPGPVRGLWAEDGAASNKNAASAPNNVDWHPSRYVCIRHPLTHIQTTQAGEVPHSNSPSLGCCRLKVAAIVVYD